MRRIIPDSFAMIHVVLCQLCIVVPTLILFQGSLFPIVEVRCFSPLQGNNSSNRRQRHQYRQHVDKHRPLHRRVYAYQPEPIVTPLLTSFLGSHQRPNLDDGDSVDTVTNTNERDDTNPPRYQRRTFFQTASLLLTTAAITTTSTAPLPSNAMYQDAGTKILLPSLNEIESSLPTIWSPDDNPFRNDVFDARSSFGRLNSSPDSNFYADPRFVEHVDSNAVSIITRYLSTNNGGGVLKKGDAVLDLCTSWTSHILPSTVKEP